MKRKTTAFVLLLTTLGFSVLAAAQSVPVTGDSIGQPNATNSQEDNYHKQMTRPLKTEKQVYTLNPLEFVKNAN